MVVARPWAGALGEQALSEGVVEFVRAAMEQVLVFAVDVRAVALAERLRVKHRCRPASELFEQIFELLEVAG